MGAVYYRLYTEDRAIPSLHPLYKNDLYLGCVLATSVAPPHTTADIKRYLCKVEKITSPATSCLFIASSEQISIDDDTRVAILAFGGPGSTPDQPLALVFKLPAAEVTSRKMAKLRALMQPAAPLEPRYRKCPISTADSLSCFMCHFRVVYYRLYAEDGEVRCKSAKLTKPYLGRINVDLVVPPHTVASLKRCITAVEGSNGFLESHLYVDLDSLSPMDEGPISILTGDCPGCTSEKPMALLYSTSRAETPTGHSNFTIPIKGKQDCGESYCHISIMNLAFIMFPQNIPLSIPRFSISRRMKYYIPMAALVQRHFAGLVGVSWNFSYGIICF